MTIHKSLSILLILLIGASFAQEQPIPPIQPEAPPQEVTPASSSFSIPWDKTAAPPVPEQPIQAPVVAVQPVHNTYETFLDSVRIIANSILPEKAKFDLLKGAVISGTAAPRDEYEKQADYEKRLADFEKTRQQKISSHEKEYQAKMKGSMDKLKAIISDKQDFQPNWAGMLRKEGGLEEFKERINKFTEKISKMKGEISQISELLGKLNLSPDEAKTLMEHWQKKNLLYITRLEKACELMQDYMLQEQTKILSTGKQKFEMSLGNYDPEKEEFGFAMNDTNSKSVTPFDYAGTIKIAPARAREINRKTDDFTANVDYINYPFIIDGTKLYLGAVKADVFYKDSAVLANGVFKSIQGYEKLNGYADWAVRADSMIKGKLISKKWDSLYAMQAKVETNIIESKVDSPSESKSFWTKGNIFRATMLVAAVGFGGVGLLKERDVSSKMDEANGSQDEVFRAQAQGEARDREKIRDRCYIGAGVAGAAFAISFFF